MKKISQKVFIFIFALMILIPMVAVNTENEKVSETERRKLAPQPSIMKDGSVNSHVLEEYEAWIDDNIGFRAEMVEFNTKLMYHIFNKLPENTNSILGKGKELNYLEEDMVRDYQHINLHSKDELMSAAQGLQAISDYAKGKGKLLFYYQCWDKHSIYPEYVPDSIHQIGNISKTDEIVDTFMKNTDVNIISSKQELIDNKSTYATYSVWGDATHWSPRGAYIGYRLLMDNINEVSDYQYKVLQEEDYDIVIEDEGSIVSGLHIEDDIERFDIKSPKAVKTNEKMTMLSEDYRHSFRTNDAVDNDTRILIIGDSYFNSFIVDDIAESFHETIMIWGDYLEDAKAIIDEYDPDIIVIEAAERVDRTGSLMQSRVTFE